jgi:chemosensory pili system protein ChpA (sensor histidine kinase/response regulator)
MSLHPFWPLIAVVSAIGALVAVRLALARRHAAAARAAREKADLAALATARRMAEEAEALAQQRAAARVISAEARRQATLRKARNAAEAEARHQATLAAASAAKTAAPALILLVDDSKMVRIKTSRLLEAHGFQVVLAADGLEALARLDTCEPALVITDVDMPHMDGFALVNRLRSNAATAHLPVAMITSAEERHRDEALRVGVGQVFGKPYVDDELIAYVRSTLQVVPPVPVGQRLRRVVVEGVVGRTDVGVGPVRLGA